MARKLTDVDIGKLHQVAELLRAWSPDIPAERFAGRGIVIAAGGNTVFTNAYVLISVLRKTLGCRLPIEVWHFGAAEMSASMAALLAELDVTVIDAEPIIRLHAADIRDGWQLKPFAMLWSGFAEVLLLDADQVPVSDPAACFDWPEYREAGAVFWPDVVDLARENPVWRALGLPARRTVSMESGQVLVDKRRCTRALAITVRLNEAADLLYDILYGDKDTFLLGWELAGASGAMVPHRPFRDDRVLVQTDFSGQRLFQHRTGAKWRYGGVQQRTENFAHFDDCLAALATLERRWSGRVFHLPDRSAAARRTEAELLSAGSLRLEIGDDERLALELLPFGEIGAGRALDRENWWCEEIAGGMALHLGRSEGRTYRFERLGLGYWQGQRLRPPVVPASLTPAPAPAPLDPAAVPGLVDELVRAARLGRRDADEAALGHALVLLGRIEPGVAARLRRLAAEVPPDVRPALDRLLLQLDVAAPAGRTVVRADHTVLHSGYRQVADDAVD